jgi:hypothetical protein
MDLYTAIIELANESEANDEENGNALYNVYTNEIQLKENKELFDNIVLIVSGKTYQEWDSENGLDASGIYNELFSSIEEKSNEENLDKVYANFEEIESIYAKGSWSDKRVIDCFFINFCGFHWKSITEYVYENNMKK